MRCWILLNAFSAFIEIIIWFLYFILSMWCVTLIDLQILNHPCIPEMNPTWSCCMIILMYCWLWFTNLLLRIFASMFLRDIGLPFSFFLNSVFVWFYQCKASLTESGHKHSFLFKFFGIVLEEWLLILFKCLVKLTCKATWF